MKAQPGITAHYWRRKQWIERWCRACIAEGFDRLVVIGAGFDTLAMRLAQEHVLLEAVEIDYPATQRRKLWALAAGAARIPPNLRFVPCDLATGPLPRAALGPGGATLVVMEGLLMYLDAHEVDRVFQGLRHCGARPLRLAFTAMATWPDGTGGFRPRSWIIDRWLSLRGEPFRWSLAPQAAEDFLDARGFRMTQLVQPRELAGAGQGRPLLEGENIVSCEAR